MVKPLKPHVIKPQDGKVIPLRLNHKNCVMLDELAKVYNTSLANVLRMGLKKLHDETFRREPFHRKG